MRRGGNESVVPHSAARAAGPVIRVTDYFNLTSLKSLNLRCRAAEAGEAGQLLLTVTTTMKSQTEEWALLSSPKMTA